MKRLFFYSMLILVFLAACKHPHEPDEFYDSSGASADKNMASVTVYLDNKGPSLNRAMGKELAQMGCDYFEVVFLYGGTAVSGQWKIGERAAVYGVYRETSIRYDNVSSSPPSGQGSAILLAGKSDRTLMAVGKLPAGKEIGPDDESVTFEVAAIKTGVSEDLDQSCFLTAAGDPSYTNVHKDYTEKVRENIENIYFLAFKLSTGKTAIKAEYTIKLDYSGANTSGIMSTYTAGGGLKVAAKGYAEKRDISYSAKEGYNINVNAIVILDKYTEVTLENNTTVGNNFDPVIKFSFNTYSTPAGSVFALVFEIPVCAFGQADYRWYIKPGYGVLKYELEEGGGIGGAVLIKTGDASVPVSSSDYQIEIQQKPRKWRYRWPGAPGEDPNQLGFTGEAEYDRVFRIDGLEVQLQYAEGASKGLPVTNYKDNTVVDSTGKITNANLTFIIGKNRVIPGTYILPDEFYGLVEVTVRFTDKYSAVSSVDYFFILVSGHYTQVGGVGHNSTSAFDYAARAPLDAGSGAGGCISDIGYDAGQPDGWTGANNFMNAIQGTGSYPAVVNNLRILRLTGSFNMSSAALELKDDTTSESLLCMIVADNDNVILGRKAQGNGGEGATILVRGNRAGLACYYFGTWPFDGLPRSPAILNNGATRPFSINPAGSATTAFLYSYTNKMMVDGNSTGQTGGLYNVILDKRWYGPLNAKKIGVDVHYPELLH